MEEQLCGLCFILSAVRAIGEFLRVGEGQVLRHNLYFQKVTLAAMTKSEKTRLEAGKPGPFTMPQEQDGGSVDRSRGGHGSKRIDLKYHLGRIYRESSNII